MPRVIDPVVRRQAVAEAVFRVVCREGVEQASLRNVAEEAGLAIGSVRHYFGSHDEMLVFAMRALTDGIAQRLHDHADRRAPIEEMLAEVLPLDDRRREEAVLWLAFATAARTRPLLEPPARDLYDGLRTVVRRVLERGQPAGDDLELETERLTALLDGLTVDAVLNPERMTPELMTAVLRRHLDSLTSQDTRITR